MNTKGCKEIYKDYSAMAMLLVASFLVFMNFYYVPGNIISYDVFGYYIYLPFTIIYNDLGLNDFSVLENLIDQYNSTSVFYQGFYMEDYGWVMKYSPGMALMYLPFFLCGHIIAILNSSYPADGFSLPYQYSLHFGSLLVSLIGFGFFRKSMNLLFPAKTTAVMILLIFFGTNTLFHMGVHGQGAMSHNYLFAISAIILYATIRWHDTFQWKYMLILGFSIGLAALSRPTEIIIASLPVLWGVSGLESLKYKFQLLIKNRVKIVTAAIIAGLFISVQFFYLKIYSGKFIINTYGAINPGEGFEFFRPFLKEFLFSFRKGWLIYTPLMFFIIPGFYYLFRKNKEVFVPVFTYFIISLWVIASWSCWWYADSFSQRSMIPVYVFLAIPLGYGIRALYSLRYIKWPLIIVLTMFVSLNLFQSWQVIKGIIHTSRMSKEYYFKSFLKTQISDIEKDLLLVDRYFSHGEILSDTSAYSSRLLYSENFAEIDDIKNNFPSGLKINDSDSIIVLYKLPFEDLTHKDHAWIRLNMLIYPSDTAKFETSAIVLAFVHNGWGYKYRQIDVGSLGWRPGEWNTISFDYITPEVRRKSNPFLLQILQKKSDDVFYIGSVEIRIFEKH